MPDHNFTLILRGDVDARLDELFEAGCYDATFGQVDHVAFAEFDRVAPTLGDAILAAITDVESVAGLVVAKVEPDDLVTASEIAERTGRTRESVRLLISDRRGPGGFPAPASRATVRNRLWRWADVQAWVGDASTGHTEVIAAINAALELRARRDGLDPEQRARIAQLAGAT